MLPRYQSCHKIPLCPRSTIIEVANKLAAASKHSVQCPYCGNLLRVNLDMGVIGCYYRHNFQEEPKCDWAIRFHYQTKILHSVAVNGHRGSINGAGYKAITGFNTLTELLNMMMVDRLRQKAIRKL